MKDLFIVGCGGFGREVADIVAAVNRVQETWALAGFIDDAPSDADLGRVEARGSRVVGGLSHALRGAPAYFVVGIGNGSVRRRVDSALREAGWKGAVLIHPSASVGAHVALGEGTILCAGVRVTTNITMGRHVHVNLNSTVGHDALIEDYVTINPLVAVSGNVIIREAALIGTHSAVLQNLEIGASSVVGAGALVTRDVGDGVVVKGLPAR